MSRLIEEKGRDRKQREGTAGAGDSSSHQMETCPFRKKGDRERRKRLLRRGGSITPLTLPCLNAALMRDCSRHVLATGLALATRPATRRRRRFPAPACWSFFASVAPVRAGGPDTAGFL